MKTWKMRVSPRGFSMGGRSGERFDGKVKSFQIASSNTNPCEVEASSWTRLLPYRLYVRNVTSTNTCCYFLFLFPRFSFFFLTILILRWNFRHSLKFMAFTRIRLIPYGMDGTLCFQGSGGVYMEYAYRRGEHSILTFLF